MSEIYGRFSDKGQFLTEALNLVGDLGGAHLQPTKSVGSLRSRAASTYRGDRQPWQTEWIWFKDLTMAKRRPAHCALCGELRLVTREHVVPRGLYPDSKANSRFQRIVIPTCGTCNNGTSDDDAHFRNVVSIAGDANPAVKELWDGPIRRSFGQVDGRRRALDIYALMQPVPRDPSNRYQVYPGRDPRILCTLRKIVRGLSHHHGLRSAVGDDEVFADVLKANVPDEIVLSLQSTDAEPDILTYRYGRIEDSAGLESGWLLRFYERTMFIGLVFESAEAKRRLEAAGELARLQADIAQSIGP
ncbi:hypothetical protein [Mesorhizobium sp. M1399]|uniref:hypothetical protein n=1 Tax=Mesorhizobium sp. M1399 TaxID=2957096 RepID=UPI00333CAB1C